MPNNRKGAAHPDNQDMLDRLKELAAKPYYENNPNYSRMFSRASKSLANHKLPITSREELMQLNGIGHWISDKLFPSSKSSGAGSKGHSKKKRKVAAKEQGVSAMVINGDDNDYDERCGKEGNGDKDCLDNSATVPSLAFEVLKPKILSHEDAEKQLSTKLKGSYKSCGKNVTSEKQFDYTRAVAYGEKVVHMLHEFTNWKVVLLIDLREQNRDDVQSKLLQSGVTCEQRHLPIGDMLWIARGMHKDERGRTLEIVLGTVVERKTAEDLGASIFGTRFSEQRLRLKYSAEGANQVIYLCEARSLRNDAGSCQAATLRSALVESMIQMGFSIVKTRDEGDTVKWLRRMHRRITRRCFPDQCETWTGPLLSPELTRRTRISPESQVFRHPPVNWENDRHHTYEEFECKLHFIRESNTRTAQSLYQAQMKQIPSFSRAKISAITKEYPTENHLSETYSMVMKTKGLRESVDLVKAIKTGKGFRQVSVGPKSSLELHYTYNCCVGEDVTAPLYTKTKTIKSNKIDQHPRTLAEVAKELDIDSSLDTFSTKVSDGVGIRCESLPLQKCNESDVAEHQEDFVFWDDPNADDDDSDSDNKQVHIRPRPAEATTRKGRGHSNTLVSANDFSCSMKSSPLKSPSSKKYFDFDFENESNGKENVESTSVRSDVRQRASSFKSFDLTQDSSDGEVQEQPCSNSRRSQTRVRVRNLANSKKLHTGCIIELSESENEDEIDSNDDPNYQKNVNPPILPVVDSGTQRPMLEESGLSQSEAIEIH
mmetsp:Transcript_7577/g.11275  ORF Transcript_7577/g.11275 Transcript_7577/m.11275 type:complete len:770 (-) Transcript_7577:170-2479(-)|eukprot:CAMPEP_0116012342 /NCGR_PEP_ID=MMETSP0321-20121206/5071_1 /TAXON_ID=163516 /ORGANISM="Leptocylindrus danicus var. danicus, Strain B650" /LENGTH=769 /DNA_ID=CAMNT_0003481677 /DNA_START=165 /DNA_END=2474 /DNA_ORIENTATION=+